MKKKINYKLVVLLAIATCILPRPLFAATFNLSYSLTEGGLRLEIDANNPYKGVKLDVSSDVATRYEIIQKVLIPLENRDDPSAQIRDNFVVRGLRGTNRYGDFRISPTDAAVRSDMVLYVSDAAGDADSITLVYGITQPENLTPGHYTGRIAFVLNPIASTRQQVVKFLDVYITVSPESGAEPQIGISTATGSRNISLNPKREETHSADVLVKINGKFRKQFNILQFLAHPFESEEGNRLKDEAISFSVKEAKKGVAINRPTPLGTAGLQNIYASNPSGDADNYFVISYNLGDLAGEKSGRYRSRIQYLLEQGGAQTKLETLELEIENERIFDLAITPADQRYAIEFRDLKATEPPRVSEVVIEALTNTGRRYQVSQEVYSDLTNKEGNIIPAQNFTLRTESLDTKGNLKFNAKQEVKKGSAVLFLSDNNGSPDKFKVIYELQSPADLRAGDYSTRITYSLAEI